MSSNGSKLVLVSFAASTVDFCAWLDKAECAVRTVIRGDGPTARASLTQVKNAAAALSLQCAAGYPSQGGIATNIGQFNRSCV